MCILLKYLNALWVHFSLSVVTIQEQHNVGLHANANIKIQNTENLTFMFTVYLQKNGPLVMVYYREQSWISAGVFMRT